MESDLFGDFRGQLKPEGMAPSDGGSGTGSSKFRDQHLSLQWFRSRVDAKVSIEAWRRDDNGVRPHSSLGYLTRAAFEAKHLLNNAPRSVVRTDDIL